MANMLDIVVWSLAALLIALTLLPLSKIPHGFVRTAEFPRIQLVIISIGLAAFSHWGIAKPAGTWLGLLFLVIAAVQSAYIIRFTLVWRRQSVRADTALLQQEERRVSFIAANVKMSNRKYDELLKVVENEDPDLVMLIEVDTHWLKAMTKLRDTFSTYVERPHDNGYGIALYSKLPLFETEVRDLLIDKVPSIRTGVELKSGDCFRLYVIHPEPPIPTKDTEGRDSEIAMAGIEAKEDPLPAVVSGDLNDVAWSSTTRRFQRLSGLLDPRVGRGFFNTFDARYPFLRWPLDHLFHDPHFQLVALKRLSKIGSDHFPILFELALAAKETSHTTPESASCHERKEVEDMAEAVANEDREALGSDWEKE